MQLSAKLNAGQWYSPIYTSIKSITKPLNILSIKLPIAPAKIKIRENWNTLSCVFISKYKKYEIIRNITIETIIWFKDGLFNNPKAKP